MGFGTVVSHIILFVSIITVAAGFLVVINNYVQGTTGSLVEKQERISSELNTDITITSVDYDNSTNPDTITAYATNTGSTQLRPNRTDLYIDDTRISRNERTITIQTDTQVDNPGIWDPDEIVEITTEQDLESGQHTLSVVAANGVTQETTFST
jgi:archaellum component FlaG (FlaF/FlaG flagellin family)